MIRTTRHPHGARFWLALLIVTPAMLALSAAAEGGLVAHLTFDQDSGSTAYDSVDGHHGALKNMDPSTDWVAGKIGNALDFDGNNDYVLVDDHPGLDFGANDFSVSVWVNKREASSGWSNIWGVNKWNTGASAGSNEWAISIGGENDDKPVFVVESGTARPAARSDDPLTLNEWHHLVGVRKGGSLLLYVDGESDATDDTLGSAAVNNVGRDLYIASAASGTSHNPDALFDDLQIYDMALSGWQVELLFDHPGAVAPVPEPATLAVWSLLAVAGIGFGRFRRRTR